MPDIAMCGNSACPKSQKCYRHKGEMGYRQSMTFYEPDEFGNCDRFIPIEPGHNEQGNVGSKYHKGGTTDV